MTMLVRWHVPDLEARADRLRWLAFEVDDGGLLRFAGGAIVLVTTQGAGRERLELVETEGPFPHVEPRDQPIPGHGNGLTRLVAVGWATVDLDRAAADAGVDAHGRTELAPDRVLGGRAVLLGAGPVVLLEPNTEARLAAALARSGEGPAAIYLATDDGGIPPGTGPVTSGPFGRCAILEPGELRGPYLVACDGRPVGSTTIAP